MAKHIGFVKLSVGFLHLSGIRERKILLVLLISLLCKNVDGEKNLGN